MEGEVIRDNELRRLERRRMRRERRLKRIQAGLPPLVDGNDSGDSGYSGRSSTTLMRSEDEGEVRVEKEEQEKEEQDMTRKRKRRTYDEEGNLLHEEYIPETEENGEPSENATEVKSKKKRLKTRKYVTETTMPDGTVIKERVESDYWSSDSEGSVHSWQQDPVRTVIHKAKTKRKKDRRYILDRATGATVCSFVTRPELERTLSPERSAVILPKIFLKFALGKRKLPEDVVEVTHRVPDSDRFLPQYHEKKQAEFRLDDEGFWDDPKAKTTAREVFDFDNLDAELDDSARPRTVDKVPRIILRTTSQDPADDVPEEQEDKVEVKREHRLSIRVLRSDLSKGRRRSKLPTIEGPKIFVSGSHDDTCDDLPSIFTQEDERTRVLASLSKLLTNRLFSRGKKRSRGTSQLVFVEERERPSSANLPEVTSRPRIMSGHQTDRELEGSEHGRGQTYDLAEVKTTESVELPPLKGQGQHSHKFTPRGQRGIGPQRAAVLRHRLQNNRSRHPLPRAPRPPREAWVDHKTDVGSKSWYLQKKTQEDQDYDEDARTARSVEYLDLDDARLRRLLEELYKDKKYMDALVAAEASSSRGDVKYLAEYGRDYLVQMALYWERRGPLPPRPSTTALGYKLERSRTTTNVKPAAKQPDLQRRKTTC